MRLFTAALALGAVLVQDARAAEPHDDALFNELKTVITSSHSAQRQTALISIHNQNLFRAVAALESDRELAYLATALLAGQEDLMGQARSRHALIRLAAVHGITDEAFLLSRILGRDEPSPAVRRAIVAILRNPAVLAEAAEKAYHQDVRVAAAKRVMEPKLAAKVQAARRRLEAQVAEVERLKQPEDLLRHVTSDQADVLARAAARGLQAQEALAAAALLPCEYPVARIIVKKLMDKALLKKVAEETTDPAMRLAVEAKGDAQVLHRTIAGHQPAFGLLESFAYSEMKGKDAEVAGAIKTLDEVARAMALLIDSVRHDQEQVQAVCRLLLKPETSVAELTDLMHAYGGTTSFHQFLHSSQPDWEEAAYQAYAKFGYDTEKLGGPLRPTGR